MLYTSIQTLHLFCACVVVGYLVYDIFIFSTLKKNRSDIEFTQLKKELLKQSVLVLGLGFLLLLISGAVLASFYIDENFFTLQNFYLQNHIQKMIWLKIALVALLIIFTLISFFFILVLKKPDPFRKYYHHLALVICLGALIVAKLLFVL